MSELHLKNNKIIKLHENAFRGTYQLKEIWFDQGIVPIEDLHLRDSHLLKILGLGGCGISSISVDFFRNVKLQALEKLYLNSNKLFDLDVEELLKNAPNLESIYLEDNKLKCSRIAEILAFCNKKVEIIGFKSNYVNSQRSKTHDTIENFFCLDDETWNTEIAKNNFQISVKENWTLDAQVLMMNEKLEKVLDLQLKLQSRFDDFENQIKNLLKEEKQ